MIRVENSEKDRCFTCGRREEVLDVVFESEGKMTEQRKICLCIECRSELHDELTPDEDGEKRGSVKELNW